MKPSVGRTVHYTSYGTPNGEFDKACRAAIVTEVETDYVVGLCVLNPTGQYFVRGVHLDEKGKDWHGGQWHWPERVDE